MKAVQFIHPMFLTALALHALVLFVPIGSEAEPELIEEDVPLTELQRETPSLSTLGKLPVPDLNVSTSAPAKIASGAIAKSKPTVPAATVRSSSRGAATSVVPSHSSGSKPKTGGNSTRASSNETTATEADRSTRTDDSQFSPPVFEVDNDPAEPNESTVDNEPFEVAANANSEDSIGTVILSELIASANTKASPEFAVSIKDLAESLTYREAATEDDTAQKRLDIWTAELSQQANAGRIESIKPVLNSDNLMEYPLESALSLEGRSLSVCLEEFPETAEIGVVFDAQGERVGQPEIIRSTGYEALDREAIALILQPETLPEDRASKAYLFDVTVDYDDESCVSLEALQK